MSDIDDSLANKQVTDELKSIMKGAEAKLREIQNKKNRELEIKLCLMSDNEFHQWERGERRIAERDAEDQQKVDRLEEAIREGKLNHAGPFGN
jgi:hypothetical protein